MSIPDGFAIRTRPHAETIQFRVAWPAILGDRLDRETGPWESVMHILGADSARRMSVALYKAATALDLGIEWQDGEWPETVPISLHEFESNLDAFWEEAKRASQ